MRINNGLLTDTLNLVQLARESALARGKQEQAQRLSPVVDELKSLAAGSRGSAAPAAGGVTASGDFRALLAASAQPAGPPTAPGLMSSDRNRMVLAMASGNMKEIDIARQLGMTLDEVRTVVSVSHKANPGLEVKK